MLPPFTWCAGPAAAHASIPALAPARSAPAPEDAALAPLRAARAAAARGDLGAALAHFDEALVRAPRCGVAYLGRAICLAGLGRTAEASLSLQEALSFGEPGPHLAFQLSRLAAREGNGELAMDLLAHAVGAEPDLAERVLRDPAYRGLRDHPRLLAVLGRL